MSVTVTSTTDSKEDILAAQGHLMSKAEPEKVEEKAASSEQQDETTDDSAESEQDEIETDESAVDESEDKLEADSEDKPKKKSGFKRRIDKLTAKATAAEQERDYWRQQAMKSQAPETEKQSKVDTKSTDKPTPDAFETHEDYVEALTDWKLEQKLSDRDMKQREKEVKTEQQRRVETHVERVKTFMAEHKDFNDLMDNVDDIPMSLVVQDIILESERSAELMYELAKHRDEYAAICKMPAIQAAREMGKFEAKYLSASTEKETTKQIKSTKAPQPITPVGSRSTNALSKSPDEMDYQDYKKWREKQLRG